MIRTLLASLLCLSFIGCQKDSDNIVAPHHGSVTVHVVDETGQPLQGVWLYVHKNDYEEGEQYSDWGKTDISGYTSFSEDFMDASLAIESQDCFPKQSILRPDTTYVVHHTPRKMRHIGDMIGYPLILGNKLFAMDGSGRYQYVEVDSEGFHAGVVLNIVPDGTVYSQLATGRNLWLSIGYQGVFKYDISDPFNPILLQSYPMFLGVTHLYDANDSILILGVSNSDYFIQLYRLAENGSIEWLSRVGNQSDISAAKIYGHQLLLADNTGLYSYDISNPKSPSLTVSFANSFNGRGYFFENSVVIITGSGMPVQSSYEPYDLADPANPRPLTRRLIPFEDIVEMADPRTIIATPGFASICLLEMSDADSTFKVTASALTTEYGQASLPLIMCGRAVWWVE